MPLKGVAGVAVGQRPVAPEAAPLPDAAPLPAALPSSEPPCDAPLPPSSSKTTSGTPQPETVNAAAAQAKARTLDLILNL
jgi:hypothetical protein